MNVVREIERINEQEFKLGVHGGMQSSWHHKYKDSAWVFVGGLSFELTEGDIICFMSQWGEIEDINLVREKSTNKSMGYAFIKYENQRSTILAVDNFNNIKLLGRTLRCDHVDEYKLSKDVRKNEEKLLDENPEMDVSIGPGHAYKSKQLENDFNISKGINLWETNAKAANNVPSATCSIEDDFRNDKKKKKSKDKDKKKDNKKSRKNNIPEESSIHIPSSDISKKRVVESEEEIAKLLTRSLPPQKTPSDTGSSQSWRGNRDPTVHHGNLSSSSDKRKSRSGGEEYKDKDGRKRNEFEGYGGINRTR